MKAIVTICIGFSCAAAFAKSRVENVAEYLRANPSTAELHVVTPDIRSEVITLLKNYDQVNAPNSPDKWTSKLDYRSRVVLLRLHDGETVERFVSGIKAWAAGDNSRATHLSELPDTRDPWFVAQFNEQFTQDDGDEIVHAQDGDVGDFKMPRSTSIGVEILKLVGACSEFSTETRRWAEAEADVWVIKEKGVIVFRKMMRQWWHANERHFIEGKFDSVTAEGEVMATTIQGGVAEALAKPASARVGGIERSERMKEVMPSAWWLRNTGLLLALVALIGAFIVIAKRKRGSSNVRH